MKSVDPMAALKAFVARYDTQGQAAAALKISQPYLHDLLRGNRAFSEHILTQLGIERHVVFTKVS